MVAKRCSTIETESSPCAIHGKPEQLISAAQMTASCTAQLVLACMAKADPLSKSCIGLRRAGMEVKKATDQLVRLAQSYADSNPSEMNMAEDEQSFGGLRTSVVTSMRQVCFSMICYFCVCVVIPSYFSSDSIDL